MLRSESRTRRVQKKRSDTPEDNDSTIAATISGLFKPVVDGLRKLPGLSAKIAPSASTLPPSSDEPATQTATAGSTGVKQPALAGPAPLPLGNVQRRWVKQMDHTAAQQVKSANSNPTGNLRLSQEEAAIDHKHYFRDDFFGGLPWAPTHGKDSEQEVVVGFRTWMDGVDFGIRDLRLSHDPRRISGQGNVPTILHWGVLGRVLRETNYIGFFVSIERTVEGEYNLIISQAPRGDFQV